MPVTRVAFTFTIDDLIDMNRRSFRGSRTMRVWRLQSSLFAGTLAGLICYFLSPGPLTLLPGPLLVRLAATFMSAAVGGLLGWLIYPHVLQRRIRRYCTEQLGSSGPWECEVELTPAALRTRQRGAELVFPWSNVASVEDIEGAIELKGSGGLVVVRDRAFTSSDDRASFLETAHHYLRCAKTPS